MFDLMVHAVFIFGFPLGVLVGYRWRDRIRRNGGLGIWPSEKRGQNLISSRATSRRQKKPKPRKAARHAGDRGGMGVGWVAVGAVLAAGALFVGFPFGVAVGYV
jgi:hypothetical protein